MEVTINGGTHNLPRQMNVIELLVALDIDETMAIVEINEMVVKREAWQAVIIKDNDTIEIVSLVGGG